MQRLLQKRPEGCIVAAFQRQLVAVFVVEEHCDVHGAGLGKLKRAVPNAGDQPDLKLDLTDTCSGIVGTKLGQAQTPVGSSDGRDVLPKIAAVGTAASSALEDLWCRSAGRRGRGHYRDEAGEVHDARVAPTLSAPVHQNMIGGTRRRSRLVGRGQRARMGCNS